MNEKKKLHTQKGGNTSQERTTDYAKESCPIKHGYKHLKIVKAT